MSSLIEYFLQRSIFVNLCSVLLIVVGGLVAATMNREAFPNVNFDIVAVTTIYPGASPEEVEKFVTNELEDGIKEVDGIKDFRSYSIENRSSVVITIDPDVSDTQKVVDDIRSAVDRTEDLPEDAEKPIITEITTSRTPVIEYALWSEAKQGQPELSYDQLRALAKQLEDRLLLLPGVARIERKGYLDREILVQLNPDALNRNYLAPLQVVNALAARNVNLPGGNLELGDRELVVRTVGEFENPAEVAQTPVRGNDIGQVVRVGDIARVEMGYEEPEYLESSMSQRAINLVVVKRESADIIKLVEETRQVVEDFKKTAPPTLVSAEFNDFSFFVKRRLGVLLSNGFFGLILVVGSLFFFMGWRTALMVALGIPIAFGMTFIVMSFLGLTLNLISMFGLIIVVGILVDDAIVVSENFYSYLERGVPAFEAAIKGTAEVISPVMATVTTTIAAFAPLMFMSGIFGKFIFTIPFVVIIALTASLLECIFFLPSHLYDVNKYSSHGGEVKGEGGWFMRFRQTVYEPSLLWLLKNRYKAVLSLLGLFVFAILIQVAFGKFKLFPGAIDALHVKITAPNGLTKEASERFVRAVEAEVRALGPEDLKNYVSRAGITQKDANDPFTRRGSNYGDIKIYLHPEDERKTESSRVIMAVLRRRTEWLLNPEALARKREQEKSDAIELRRKGVDFAEIQAIPVRARPEYADLAGQMVALEFDEFAGGPPVGKPVAIEITGDDFATLQQIADEYKAILRKIPGVKDIEDDYLEGKDEVRLRANDRLLAQTGISVQQLALTVNTAFAGAVATTVRRADEEIDIRVRFDEPYRQSLESILKINVVNNQGNLIPLSRVTSSTRGVGVRSINHFDGRRLITVAANIGDEKLSPGEVARRVEQMAAAIPAKYPGYSIVFGGENKDTEESFASLGRAMAIAAVIIYMILASTFRSLVQPLIVMAAIPFSFIGVILAFVTHQEPFSFLAFMGVVGLSGVVVNDSIVLIDFANRIKQENPELTNLEVAHRAGSARLRAVLLTTLTTVLGLLPTAYGIGGKDPFIVPMALSFAYGLIFATALTLGFVPILFMGIENRKDRLRHWIDHRFGRRGGAPPAATPALSPFEAHNSLYPEGPERDSRGGSNGGKKRRRN